MSLTSDAIKVKLILPRSIRAAEISAEGVSIFKHEPGGTESCFRQFS